MSAACTPESFTMTHEFVTAEEYGGPLGAALAMQISASGLYKTAYEMLPDETRFRTLPDMHTVNAFARRRLSGNTDDIDSVLGVALSCTEIGGDVVFMGQHREVDGYTAKWLERLEERPKLAEISDKIPTARDITRLLHENRVILLHANGEAFQAPASIVHPVVVTGKTQRTLQVDNPGGPDIAPASEQKINARLALHSASQEVQLRISLLAIRKIETELGETTIRQATKSHWLDRAK